MFSCEICLENTETVQFLQCMHFVFIKCLQSIILKRLRKCPWCRTRITFLLKKDVISGKIYPTRYSQ
jgi:hypothetical protein